MARPPARLKEVSIGPSARLKEVVIGTAASAGLTGRLQEASIGPAVTVKEASMGAAVRLKEASIGTPAWLKEASISCADRPIIGISMFITKELCTLVNGSSELLAALTKGVTAEFALAAACFFNCCVTRAGGTLCNPLMTNLKESGGAVRQVTF